MTSQTYRLLGGPGSPYSLKMRAVLRYRRLPHVWIVPPGYIGTGGELAAAGKKMIPVLQLPEDGRYWADSTPMIYALEQRHSGQRSLIPDDPADAFLAHLVEDFADELLVLAMFAHRWGNEADRQFCPRRQLSGWLGAAPTASFESFVGQFTDRQVKLLQKLGGIDTNLSLYEHVYHGVLALIEQLLTEQRYLFGTRPSIAEIGLFGQLSQCAIDPTASVYMKQHAPRAFQWVQDLDDASGMEGEWRQPGEAAPAALAGLLRLVAKVYLPYATAQSEAVVQGAERVSTRLDGLVFEGAVNPYTPTCLLWLKDEYARLDAAARSKVDAALGAEAVALMKFRDGEAQQVPPHVPV